jgi:hypothetical protein
MLRSFWFDFFANLHYSKEREAAYETLMIEKEEEIKKLTSEVSVLAAANTKGTCLIYLGLVTLVAS